jgi:hypothetical protein
MPKDTLFIVVTTISDGERELFPDIVLITPSETKARNLTRKLRDRAPVRGLDYSLLSEFTGAAYFTRRVGDLSCWTTKREPYRA